MDHINVVEMVIRDPRLWASQTLFKPFIATFSLNELGWFTLPLSLDFFVCKTLILSTKGSQPFWVDYSSLGGMCLAHRECLVNVNSLHWPQGWAAALGLTAPGALGLWPCHTPCPLLL
jgi:hypothetical protein